MRRQRPQQTRFLLQHLRIEMVAPRSLQILQPHRTHLAAGIRQRPIRRLARLSLIPGLPPRRRPTHACDLSLREPTVAELDVQREPFPVYPRAFDVRLRLRSHIHMMPDNYAHMCVTMHSCGWVPGPGPFGTPTGGGKGSSTAKGVGAMPWDREPGDTHSNQRHPQRQATHVSHNTKPTPLPSNPCEPGQQHDQPQRPRSHPRDP